MATYKIVRKPNMNRLYITGNAELIRQLLSDFHARTDRAWSECPECAGSGLIDRAKGWADPANKCACDYGKVWGEQRYWLPLHQEPSFRAALKAEGEYQARIAAETARWEQAKSAIPADYKTRHGAMYGGAVSVNGERSDEPGLDTTGLPWVKLAWHDQRVRDLTGQSLIDGRVMNSDVLYSATVADGRAIYRISHYGSFGDDLRETYYLPADLWERMMAREVRMRGITPEAARAWLAQYQGCVGTELYEYAAGAAQVDHIKEIA